MNKEELRIKGEKIIFNQYIQGEGTILSILNKISGRDMDNEYRREIDANEIAIALGIYKKYIIEEDKKYTKDDLFKFHTYCNNNDLGTWDKMLMNDDAINRILQIK